MGVPLPLRIHLRPRLFQGVNSMDNIYAISRFPRPADWKEFLRTLVRGSCTDGSEFVALFTDLEFAEQWLTALKPPVSMKPFLFVERDEFVQALVDLKDSGDTHVAINPRKPVANRIEIATFIRIMRGE